MIGLTFPCPNCSKDFVVALSPGVAASSEQAPAGSPPREPESAPCEQEKTGWRHNKKLNVFAGIVIGAIVLIRVIAQIISDDESSHEKHTGSPASPTVPAGDSAAGRSGDNPSAPSSTRDERRGASGISTEEWMDKVVAAFPKEAGHIKATPKFYLKESDEFFAVVGQPDRKQVIGENVILYWRCSDGVVQMMASNLSLEQGNGLWVESINRY